MKKLFIFVFAVVLSFSIMGTANAGLVDLGGGMIFDNDINLAWLQDANYPWSQGLGSNGLMQWDNAMAYVAGLNYGGQLGWRLPTVAEMQHLYPFEGVVPPGNIQPANMQLFTYTQYVGGGYWSSEAVGNDEAKGFNFYDGLEHQYPKINNYLYLWPVHQGNLASVLLQLSGRTK
jgi:hypothetical protein